LLLAELGSGIIQILPLFLVERIHVQVAKPRPMDDVKDTDPTPRSGK